MIVSTPPLKETEKKINGRRILESRFKIIIKNARRKDIFTESEKSSFLPFFSFPPVSSVYSIFLISFFTCIACKIEDCLMFVVFPVDFKMGC